MPKAGDYPECDKLADSEANVIFQFLEWLECEKGVFLEHQEGEMINHEDLVYEYFDIDKKKLEKERREILKSHQELQEKSR